MLIYPVVLLVSLMPGWLLGFAVPPGRERWIAWAAAPVLTLGLTAAAVAWLPVAGLPSAALWVLAAEIVLAALIAAGSWLVARRRPAAAPVARPATARVLAAAPARAGEPAFATEAAPARRGDLAGTSPAQVPTWREWLISGSQRPRLADLAGAAVPVAVAMGFGRLLLGGLSWPPGWDAMNHARLTRNIIDTGSTAITAICTTGRPLPQVACHFYPLSADVSWAQTAILSGGRISSVMLAWSMLLGPAIVAVASYTAVRIFGGRPLVAGCAAIVPTLLSGMWPSLARGRPPETFAPGMSIAVAVLITLAVRGKHPVRFGLLAGVGAAGLVMTHTYNVLFTGALSLAFILSDRTFMKRRTALTGMGVIALTTLAACVPLTGGLLAVRSETAAVTLVHVMSFGQAWHYWVTDLSGYTLLSASPLHILPIRAALWLVLPALLASPLCFVIKELRWARPWLLTWAGWTALGIWTSVSASPVAVFVSSLWYAEPARLRTMAYPLHGVLAVAGACAIGLGLYRLARTTARRARDLRLENMTAGVAAGALAVSLIGLAAAPSAHQKLVRHYRRAAAAGAAYRHAFSWLARHTQPGKVIAYDTNKEFITWAYDDYNVPGLFGFAARVKASEWDQAERWLAWDWLVGNPGMPSGCLVRRYRIEYVVAGRRHLPGWPADYTRADLAASPRVKLVHRDGGIRIYRVTKAGMACLGEG